MTNRCRPNHTAAASAVIFGALFSPGCAVRSADFAGGASSDQRPLAIIVPGVFGDGPWYDGLRHAAGRAGDRAVMGDWGRGKLLFFANFSNLAVHSQAEAELAQRIDSVPAAIAIDLVGHSAGCGVILGALRRTHRHVRTVVLLAASVSPTYPIDTALEKVDGRVFNFFSDRDTTFLKWRTSHFGTYDGVKAIAAGNQGFAAATARLTQIAYRPEWQSLGNDGGHDGWLVERFVLDQILPLLTQRPQRLSPEAASAPTR